VSTVGIGVDVVDVARFAAVLRRTPAVAERLFTIAERSAAGDRADRLAARFAAKEAVAKVLDARGLRWHDTEVVAEPGGRPALNLSGAAAAAAGRHGVHRWHISLSHDGPVAVAVVVGEA
jgi:holo-[acyl-carrier protein] synthase